MGSLARKKKIVMTSDLLMDFKDLSARVYQKNGIRLNLDHAAKEGDRESLRVWERTFLEKGDQGRI